MEEKEVQERFHLLQQEVEAAIALVEEVKLTCAAATDVLKFEIEVLRRFLERSHPDFTARAAELRTHVAEVVVATPVAPLDTIAGLRPIGSQDRRAC
jgi:hypothetical protein